MGVLSTSHYAQGVSFPHLHDRDNLTNSPAAQDGRQCCSDHLHTGPWKLPSPPLVPAPSFLTEPPFCSDTCLSSRWLQECDHLPVNSDRLRDGHATKLQPRRHHGRELEGPQEPSWLRREPEVHLDPSSSSGCGCLTKTFGNAAAVLFSADEANTKDGRDGEEPGALLTSLSHRNDPKAHPPSRFRTVPLPAPGSTIHTAAHGAGGSGSYTMHPRQVEKRVLLLLASLSCSVLCAADDIQR